VNKKLGKYARLRLDGDIAAQVLDLLASKEQPNAAVFTFVEKPFVKIASS
jgi:hypothetical protein